MRRLCGSSASRQPRAAPCASAAAASARSSEAEGSASGIWPRSARVTRARISAAALRVKVIARISPASSTVHRSFRKRCVSTAVLPEPARASRSTETAGSLACARAAASVRAADSLISVLREGEFYRTTAMLGDAAQGTQVTVVAGPGRRIHPRVAGEEGADQALDQPPPLPLLLAPGCRKTRLLAAHRLHPRQELPCGRDTAEAHLARVHVHGGEGDDIGPERGKVGEQLRMRRSLAVPVRRAGLAALV